MPVVRPPRWSVLLVLALLAPAVLAGCTSAVSGTAVADPAATTTTTTRPPTTTTRPTAPTDALPDGAEVLLAPTIAVRKTTPTDAAAFCALVTAEDVTAAFGLTLVPQEAPDGLCSPDFEEGGYVFVSNLGTFSGTPIEIGGNSALLAEQRNGTGSCQVTVALSETALAGDVLDIDARGVTESPRDLCEAVQDFARRVFDRLPNA